MANNKIPKVLTKRQDFIQTYKLGRKVHPCTWLTINYKTNVSGELRVGWTVPRFVGTAVVRNRLKRWCREYIRQNLIDKNDRSIDTNIVFRRSEKEFYKKMKYDELDKQLERAFKKIV